MNPLFQIPESFEALSDDELREWIAAAQETAQQIAGNPVEFVSEERSTAELMDEMQAGVEAIELAQAELAKRTNDADVEDEPADQAAISDEEQARLSDLADRATLEAETDPPADEGDGDGDGEGDGDDAPESTATLETDEPEPADAVEEPEPVVAAATPARRARRPLPRPARSRVAAPAERPVALTAAAENLGAALGEEIDVDAMADMMIRRRRMFGVVPEGTHGEKIPIARADWGELYPEERKLSEDGVEANWDKIQAVTASAEIKRAFRERRDGQEEGALLASGGLCAPVAAYYQLQVLAVADRPVRAALPSFNADRGGIRAARPASLAAITTGVATKTVAEDAAGGSSAVKACQVIDCPEFEEVDVAIIHHCLQFGNLGARTFPELVAQWNSLVLAAHAREAETNLLDGISAASTQVTADLGNLGASADLLGQILVAAAGMRSRHRMDKDAVLRALLPQWILDMLVSDVYRTQFGRFEMTPERFVTLIRAGNVEPSFYMDGASGAGQVFGAQGAGVLTAFPTTAEWYLFPEGSFLYLDGGTLELGLVRDSVLNETNDFQIFGESFENVAFIGVESLEVRSNLCDNGAVSLPIAIECPVNYA